MHRGYLFGYPLAYTLGRSQAVRHGTLTPAFRRSESCRPNHVGAKSALLRLLFCLRRKRSHPPAPLLLLFRKRARSARLFGCKRPHDGSQSLPPFCGRGATPRFDKVDQLGPGAVSRSGPFALPKIFARVQNRSKLTAPAKQKGTGKGALLFGPEGFEPERQGLAWAELSTAAGGGGREKAPAQRSAKPSRASGEG